MTFSSLPRSLAAGSAALLCLALTSCESPPRDALAEAAAMGERPVAMSGNADFFTGRVVATVTVSRGLGRKPGGPNGDAGQRGSRSRGNRDGPRPSKAVQPDPENMEPEEAQVYYRARQAIGSPLPPVTTHLKLENRGAEPVEIEILEVSSDLGNFAVRPAKLTIAPGQTGEPDPMISQLGVTSDEIPVKVILKVSGAKETQTLAVHSVRSADTPEARTK